MSRQCVLGHSVKLECSQCGACCVAPDIAALDKPLGLRCPHLSVENLCTVYDRRPAVCRSYEPDELCSLIAADSLEERVEKYLAYFQLSDEAANVKRGCTSMKKARNTVHTGAAID